MTTGQLKEILKEVPDDLEIRLTSETNVDQNNTVTIDGVYRVSYGEQKKRKAEGRPVLTDFFAIFANSHPKKKQDGDK